jgi:hypothetical protein
MTYEPHKSWWMLPGESWTCCCGFRRVNRNGLSPPVCKTKVATNTWNRPPGRITPPTSRRAELCSAPCRRPRAGVPTERDLDEPDRGNRGLRGRRIGRADYRHETTAPPPAARGAPAWLGAAMRTAAAAADSLLRGPTQGAAAQPICVRHVNTVVALRRSRGLDKRLACGS